MTVGGAFVYVVKTCERGCVYNSVCFSRGPRRPRYNGVAVYNITLTIKPKKYTNINKHIH